MKFSVLKKTSAFVITLIIGMTSANASIVVTGTRVIYPSDAREVSVKLSNKGVSPVLVQSWIDTGNVNETPEKINVPFTLTPPINRVEAGKGQTLRISAASPTLPKDRESIFWLNVLEIPAKKKVSNPKDSNFLQVAFRTRIKMFYRPAGLQGDANKAAKELKWTYTANGIKVTNPTPYFVSLSSVSLGAKKTDGEMVPPISSLTIKLSAPKGSKLAADFINDYGAVMQLTPVVE